MNLSSQQLSDFLKFGFFSALTALGAFLTFMFVFHMIQPEIEVFLKTYSKTSYLMKQLDSVKEFSVFLMYILINILMATGGFYLSIISKVLHGKAKAAVE